MNEARFYKLSMDLRDLARKIPLHWGQVQNNKVDDKINMFDIYHYEELEKQIASLPITSQNYLRRRWYLWKCSECDEYLFYCNDNVEKNPNKYDKEYDVKINNRYHFDIKGTVVPREMRDNIEKYTQSVKNVWPFLKKKQYFVLVIGDLWRNGEVIPLGFYLMYAIKKAVKCELKGIVVKDMVGNRGKIGSEGIWKYRALKNGNFLFKHEYIFVFKKK